MSIRIEIKKKLYSFELNVKMNSESRRIGILGASGCGKSMTLKCIAGIETPESGQIRIDGRTLFERDGRKKGVCVRTQDRNVGYLFQNYALFPTMNVEKNIGVGLRCGAQEKREIVSRMVKKFRLEGLEKRLPGELSGGQQQRVALARILAYEPDVILLDEPFSALDGFLKDRLQQELMELLEGYEGTVILVSHSRDEIYRFSEELVIMDDGRTICQGKTNELFERPVYREAARLTGCKNIARAERIDAHTLFVPAWGVRLALPEEIPPDITYVGVRAHDFAPRWRASGERELPGGYAGTIPVGESSLAQFPFERKYFIKTNSKEDVCWYVQREWYERIDEAGMPDELLIPVEKLLLLRE